MTEKKIQLALYKKFISHIYKFTNVYYFGNESDWLSFLQSGYCYEVEIKISRGDFKADFKKNKHLIHSSNEKEREYYTEKGNLVLKHGPDWEFLKNFPELVESREYSNYRRSLNSVIDLYYYPCSEVSFRKYDNLLLPNKFFYAVPKGLISKEEVPDYAGLLYVDENLNIEKVKDGKFLHTEKLSVIKLFQKTYNSYERELIKKLR